jgi:hypothetical protein
MVTKECSSCGQRLLLEAFHQWRSRSGVKFGKWCETCYQTQIGCRLTARRAVGAKRRAHKRNATPKWADEASLRKIYELADAVTKITGNPHHVEHWIPLGGEKAEIPVSGLHTVENLRVCPAELNAEKSNSFGPRDARRVELLAMIWMQGRNKDTSSSP